MSKRNCQTIFGLFRNDDQTPVLRRPTSFLSDTFNVSPTPTSDSRNSSPSPSPAHGRQSVGSKEKALRRPSILHVLDSIAGTRFRKSSVASSVAASITSSRSIRTLKDVKDELQMQDCVDSSGRKRKGSIADLHDSVHATGIVIRDSFGPEPFTDHLSVLSVDDEVEEGEKRRYFAAIRCGRPFSKVMDIIMALIALWSMVWVPLSVTFENFIHLSEFWSVVDGILSAMYLVGVVLNFFTSKPLFAHVKEIVYLSAIRSHIFHSLSFYLDLITAVPWMIITPHSPIRWVLVLRGHRLLRMPLSWEESIRCSAISGLSDFLAMFRVIIWFFLLSHNLGCAWFTCQGPVSRERHVSSVPPDERTPWTYYIQAFRDGAYMLMTRDRPAYSELEVAVVGCMGPSGAFFIIWMTGHFAVLLQRLQALTSKNFEELSLIRAAMNRQRLPKELQFRVLRFHYYSYLQHDLLAYQVLFRSLSSPLTCEIKFWIFRKLIRYVPFFQDASPKAIKSIVLALTLSNYSPGDVIIRCGDQSADMYFIIKGFTQVLDAQGLQPIKKLKAGEYFGEFALLHKSKRRTTWVRADSFCCLAELTSQSFEQILSEFPEQRSLMLAQIKAHADFTHRDSVGSTASFHMELDRIEEASHCSRRNSNTSSIMEVPLDGRASIAMKGAGGNVAVLSKVDGVLENMRLLEARINARLNTIEQCIRAEAPTARMTPYNVSSHQSRRESESNIVDTSVMSTPKRRSSSLNRPIVHSSATGRESLCIPHSIITQTITEASAASTTRSSQATVNQAFSPKQLQEILSRKNSARIAKEEEPILEAVVAAVAPQARDSDNESAQSMVSDNSTEPRSTEEFRVDEDLDVAQEEQ